MKDSNRWRSCAALGRCLILVAVFAPLLPINQLVEGAGISPFDSNYFRQYGIKNIPSARTPIKVCYSAACRQAASEMAFKMNYQVNPCDDFYQFACGNYNQTTQIPEDKSVVNTFSVIEDKINEQLKDIIEAERDETEPNEFQMPNLLYKACTNTTLIESLGTKPMKQISDSLGGWPVVVGTSWDTNGKWNWQDTVKRFKRLGFGTYGIVSFSVYIDFKNNTKRIIYLDQPSTGLRREYLIKGFNETSVSAYYDYMVDIAVLFGADKDAAKKEMNESLQFEMDLANISWPHEKRRNTNDLYNLRTIKQLQEAYPYVDWLDYINGHLAAGVQVDENEVVNLTVPSFFDALGKLLNRSNKRVIANYLMWRIHAASVSFLPEEIQKKGLKFSSVSLGKQKFSPRWKKCVDVANSLSFLVGSLYVRKYFKEDSKAIALEIVNNIWAAFSQMLDEVNWMDHETKQEAKRKLHAMAAHIGYPDELLDNDKVAEIHSKLEIDPEKYLESFLNINVFATDYFLNKLRLPVNKTDWVQHSAPAVVNAFYNALENSIQFPAGILQGHFFNSQRPKYMNYGAIGSVIGHEITHGFDDQGRQYDAEGNLANWWHPDTKKKFLEKARCIIEQYGNFTDKQTGLKLNGINTQGENIADNGGIKAAYLAYNKYVAENGEEPRLPGFNYTPNQLFFISAAQNWCSKYRTESLNNKITTDVHPPGEFRVLGFLSNMKEFSSVFQCPGGTPMNAVHKCKVW